MKVTTGSKADTEVRLLSVNGLGRFLGTADSVTCDPEVAPSAPLARQEKLCEATKKDSESIYIVFGMKTKTMPK